MKRIAGIFLGLAIGVGSGFAAHAVAAGSSGGVVENPSQSKGPGGDGAMAEEKARTQLLVKFDDTISDEEIAVINRRLGARVIDRMLGGRLLLVEIPYAETRDQIVHAYMGTAGVVFAEPNRTVSIPTPPDEEGKGTLPGDGGPGDNASPIIKLPQVE